MRLSFLDLLDDVLARGMSRLSGAFAREHAGFILSRQQPDGGFAGRRGTSDLYYTEFAVRTLELLKAQPPGFAALAQHLRRQREPHSVVECFSLANLARLLARHGEAVPLDGLGARLAELSAGDRAGAYDTFLAALCCDAAGIELPRPGAVIAAVRALRQQDGGFRESPGEGASQTNATAAAAAFLAMHGALRDGDAAAAGSFLARAQAPDGGLRAHAGAPEGDLLSTFSGLTALWLLQRLDGLDLSAAARFLKATSCVGGGFRASPSDDEPDVEYTWYGTAAAALLRAHAMEKAGEQP